MRYLLLAGSRSARFLGSLFILAAACSAATTQPSADPLGATPHSGGTTFRVWAPSVKDVAAVDQVSVKVNGGDPVVLDRETGHTDDDATWSKMVPGVKAGDTYKYLVRTNGTVNETIDPRSRQLTSPDAKAASVVVDLGDPLPQFDSDTFNKLVIYELHIGTFNAGAANRKFDFSGAGEKLDYLQKLGVNAIEVMPVHENHEDPNHHPSDFNWGFDVVQLFAVEHAYGSPLDLKNFVKACHDHKIAVILDVVYNHLVQDNLIRGFGGIVGPTFSKGIFFYGDNRGDTPFGPRPDFGRPQVRAHVTDDAFMWLRDYGVDGLRWDSTSNIRATQATGNNPQGIQLLQEFNAAKKADSKLAGKITIAEDLASDVDIVTPTGKQDDHDLGFNSQWDDDLFRAVRDAVIAPLDSSRDLGRLKGQIERKLRADDVFSRVIYSENHDKVGHPNDQDQGSGPLQIRLPALIDQTDHASIFAKKRSTLAAAIILTSPGIPMLFQGQEMLDDRAFQFFDATPVQWDHTKKFEGIVRIYRDLIALRRNVAGKTAGLSLQGINAFHADLNGDKILAFHRFGNGGSGDDVVVVANFSNQRLNPVNIGFPRGGTWKVRFNSGANTYDATFTDGDSFDVITHDGGKDNLPFNGDVGIGAYSVVILSQD